MRFCLEYYRFIKYNKFITTFSVSEAGVHMIEIKNIVKTYRPKKGGTVKALDNVSLKFPEKGLVFVLGKSGSGKSTLLNVMGGLDTADSGEIIIKGKSSNDFSTGDFDSYRNTYLGFIFQEYNILEDFNVGANIALALKLQGEKATDDKINEILEEVGLSGYGRRKPNELSGGQKQRVAIARALVKNPEIIMADEPTGALDSNTGIQVFDTLKKLSRDKLVIVVSHDREFAEEYGDRVIELKDGAVISDIEKHRIAAEVGSGGAENYKGKLLRFPKGYKLTVGDVKRINDYLENDEAFLSFDAKINSDVKAASHIDENGKMETFAPTDENAITTTDEKPFGLIKSRMPVKENFRMGVSGMKTKPFRLIFTILLCFCCFAMFGIVDSFASYDSVQAVVNSMYDSGIQYSAFTKQNIKEHGGRDFSVEIKLTDADVEYLKNVTGLDLLPVVTDGIGEKANIISSFLTSPKSMIYNGDVAGVVSVDAATLEKHNLSMLAGRVAAAKDEIAISDYAFDCFKKWGYRYVDEEGQFDESKNINAADITSAEEFLSKSPNVEISGRDLNGVFRIGGIVKTGYDYSRYSSLDGEVANGEVLNYFVLQSQFDEESSGSFSGMFFAYENFAEDFFAETEYKGVGGRIPGNASIYGEYANDEDNYDSAYLGDYSNYFTVDEYPSVVYLDDSTTLSGNGVAINVRIIVEALINLYGRESSVAAELESLELIPENASEIKDAVNKYMVKGLALNMLCYEQYDYYFDGNVELKGFFFDDETLYDEKTYSDSSSYIGVSQEMADVFKNADAGGKYAGAISGEKLSKAELEKIVNFSMTTKDGVRYALSNYVVTLEDMVGSLIKTVAKVLLYVGIGIFVFAIILFTTYIGASVSYKKREIGILRALGASSGNVFGIFFSEALVIALIIFALATIGSGVTVALVNVSLRASYGLPITLLHYGIREIAIILAGCILTALAASFVPVLRIARKKPVDAIKNR